MVAKQVLKDISENHKFTVEQLKEYEKVAPPTIRKIAEIRNTGKYKNIDKYISEKHISLREFSKLCDIPCSTMSRVLNGNTEPKKSTIDKILNATDMKYEYLFSESEEKPNE